MFWITVGAPVLADRGPTGSALFLSAFYVLLIGSKVAVAGVVDAGRARLLEGGGYAVVLRLTALLLVATGVLLIVDAIEKLE